MSKDQEIREREIDEQERVSWVVHKFIGIFYD